MTEPMTPALTGADFPAFYRGINGHDPFPWQADLTTRVLADGRWPDLVDIPTGLGKTSLLDIAVFVTAVTAHLQHREHAGRRRLFLVVDRRLVVDEAHQHACALAERLQDAEGVQENGVLGRVAAGLRCLTADGAGELLPVTRMRGGTTWAAAWLDRPDRPGIVLGTVDQVGSRIFFRGYGVSDRRRPLDAALVGTDSLIMVDEAHLATALLTTIDAAQQRDQLGLPVAGLTLVRLSATAHPSAHSYRLDVAAHRDTPVAWQRLTAGKRLKLRETRKNCAKVLAQAAAEHLRHLAESGRQAPAALVVCNTVDRARDVYTRLEAAMPDVDCELLIGRSREIDRPGLQDRVLRLLGTNRSPAQRAAVLVATQTVEVGVNLDADLLITESASWDALVQRLGRLNRLGHFAKRFPGQAAAEAIVVHDTTTEDPVYGAARDTTWQALKTLITASTDDVNVSPLACRGLTTTVFDDPACTRAPGDVPILLSPTLDAWAQTSPVPLNDPPVAPYLHGFDAGTASVQVAWRDSLLIDPRSDGATERAASQVDALLTLWPPRTPEIVEVPFVAVRRWMSGQPATPVGDVDITDGDTTPTATADGTPFRVLAQRPSPAGCSPDTPASWQWIDDTLLRPGDRIIVPTERGGLDTYGWAPNHHDPVSDVSEAAAFTASRARREAALRLDNKLPTRLGLNETSTATITGALAPLTTPRDDPPTTEETNAAGQLLAQHLPAEPPPHTGWTTDTWATLRSWLTADRLRILNIYNPNPTCLDDEPRPWARLLAGPRPDTRDAVPAAEGDDEEVAASSIAAKPVTLTRHHDAVRRRAGEIARALQLPTTLTSVIEDAAGWHDLGKIEERFQIMLHNGDPVAAALSLEPLAKSGMDPTDRMAWRRAHHLSRLPTGARHEAWSAALIEEHLHQRETPYPGDADLLIHLMASHHGYARPLARLVADTEPRPVQALIDAHKATIPSDRTVSLEHPARFARLNRRYGRWGLALLETIVRCADTTISGEGS